MTMITIVVTMTGMGSKASGIAPAGLRAAVTTVAVGMIGMIAGAGRQLGKAGLEISGMILHAVAITATRVLAMMLPHGITMVRVRAAMVKMPMISLAVSRVVTTRVVMAKVVTTRVVTTRVVMAR